MPRSAGFPRSTSVAIVGGGIMGLSAAWHLARRGQRDITVFDTATIGSGASGRTGALLRQHYSNRHEAALAHWSLDFYRRWPELIDSHPVHTATPLVVTVPTGPGFETNIDHLRSNVSMQQAIGIQTRIITGDELRALQPHARADDLRCAALEAVSGYVDAPSATRAIAVAARRLGVRIFENTPVTAVVTSDSAIKGIRAGGSMVEAEHVICAAGALTPVLLRPAGLILPISALRVQVAVLQRTLPFEPAHFAYVDTAAGFFARPFGPGRSLVGIGGGAQHDPVNPMDYRQAADDDYANRAQRVMARRFPAMAGATPVMSWAGLYDMTPDAHPIIGAAGPEGLIVMAGFSGAGFKKAPALGHAVAGLVLEESSQPFDLAPFRYDRFSSEDWKLPWSPTEYQQATDFGHGL